MLELPRLFRVRQTLARPQVADLDGSVALELAKLNLAEKIRPGQSVAITAGSRGISNIARILRGIVQHLRGLGAEPFIVPAMGSHGGGVAEEQRRIIERYGVTEEYVGCPIRASMDTIVVCQAAEGFPVHFDALASQADHVLVCNRVKPHTNFTGTLESGLMKMMLIGLGKHAGAKVYHRAIIHHSFDQIIRSVAKEVRQRCKIVAGLAIVENGHEETAIIEGIHPAEFETREAELLTLAKEWLPRLPFRTADLLILDEIGKEISGAGMDTNVVGRKFTDHMAGPDEWPKILRIMIRGLSAHTAGNAAGLGIAEFCRTRVIEEMNYQKTIVNCITGGHPMGGMLPIHLPTDREVIEAALSTTGLVPPEKSQIQWVRNTLHLAEVECSEAYWEEAQGNESLEILVEPRPFEFDDDGNLMERF